MNMCYFDKCDVRSTVSRATRHSARYQCMPGAYGRTSSDTTTSRRSQLIAALHFTRIVGRDSWCSRGRLLAWVPVSVRLIATGEKPRRALSIDVAGEQTFFAVRHVRHALAKRPD